MPGPRRHTAQEAALSGPMNARKHRESATAQQLVPQTYLWRSGRNGTPGFSRCRRQKRGTESLSRRTTGLLHEIDADTLAALAAAIAVHQKSVRLSQEA